MLLQNHCCRRFVRCVKVVCCQQEAYADANKVLFSKRLRVKKVSMHCSRTALLCP